jgi:hypothetical protein
MTKVQRTFKLARALSDSELTGISRIHAVIGFFALRLTPGGDELLVEYDASRLSPKEVRGSLEQHGIPLAPPTVAEPPKTETPIAS